MKSSSSRRHFLAAAGASVSFAVHGAPKRIRTGILGIQHSHLTGKLQAMLDNPAYEVAAICEPDPATLRQLGSNQLFAPLQRVSLEQMLADRSLDLIVFEGQVKDAVPYARMILEAGKHLHLEKPPANTLEPFREIVELARRRDRKLQLGYIWRFHAGVEAAFEAHRRGWLGDLYMIRATVNSDRDPRQRFVEARYPGGSMFELGGHMIDRVIAFLGRPTRVRDWLRHDTGIPDRLKDNTLAVLEYPSALAIVVSSARDPAMHRSFEVIGSEGSILIDPMEPAPLLRIHMRTARGPYRQGTQELRLPPQPRFIKDFEELARAIQLGAPLRYSYDHELLLQETLLRASGE